MTLQLRHQRWNNRACMEGALGFMGQSGCGSYMFVRVSGELLTSEYLFKAPLFPILHWGE